MTIAPYFSIIIPTYNRPAQLMQCLEALMNLSYPKTKYEVIIVDDGSDGDLFEMIKPFQRKVDIQLIKQENLGPASARNKGASYAKGTYLAFTDDDCRPAPDWLTVIAKQLEKKPRNMIGGKTINSLKDNLFSITSQLITDIVYRHYNANPKASTFFASNNMVIPKDSYQKIGGFPSKWRYAEDRELCDRWLLNGEKMTFVPKAVIFHAHDLHFWTFCKQHFQYGQGAYYYHKIRKIRKSGTMRKELNFHANLKNWLLVPFHNQSKKPFRLFLLLMLWQISNLIGFFWSALSNKIGQGFGWKTNLVIQEKVN